MHTIRITVKIIIHTYFIKNYFSYIFISNLPLFSFQIYHIQLQCICHIDRVSKITGYILCTEYRVRTCGVLSCHNDTLDIITISSAATTRINNTPALWHWYINAKELSDVSLVLLGAKWCALSFTGCKTITIIIKK